MYASESLDTTRPPPVVVCECTADTRASGIVPLRLLLPSLLIQPGENENVKEA